MNHREPPQLSAATRRIGLGLVLSLLPAVTPLGVHASTRSYTVAIVSRSAEPTPYLAVTGAPPLRFREVVVPADPTPRPADVAINPPAPAPVAPTATPEPASVAAPAASTATTPATEPSTVAAPPTSRETTPPPPAKIPAKILPDDSRPAIRAEDFIPYFQIPNSARNPDVTLLVPVPKAPPAPASLPASSATYTQSPK